MFSNRQYSSHLISDALLAESPKMIARIGSTEMQAMTTYMAVTNPARFRSVVGYITNRTPPWWWSTRTFSQLRDWSGFFPARRDEVERFCELMISSLSAVDILGSWLKEEAFFADQLRNAKRVMLEDLEPFFCERPWTLALKGKRVIVVHPFSATIKSQYQKRRLLFESELLPEFELECIPAVQSLGGAANGHVDWFGALEHLKNELERATFDVCILGCGAYGFPLAAHVKRLGKHAVHLGGVTQLLFGIRGRRWDNFLVYPYMNLYNDSWVRAAPSETPANAASVEDGCYW